MDRYVHNTEDSVLAAVRQFETISEKWRTNGVNDFYRKAKSIDLQGFLNGQKDNMKLGVIGLPNVGKSTLFNAITQAGAQAANYPFCTIEPNVGVVAVPDERLDVLAKMYDPQKYTPATIEFVDIAGLVRGAYRGEGLGNKFLSHIREVDAVVHVVRCFEDGNIVHVDGSVDPVRDMETINIELIFADLDTVERRLDKARKSAKSGEKKYLHEIELLERIQAHLEKQLPVRSMEMNDDEREEVRELFLLTTKPVIYAANIAEDEIGTETENVVHLTPEGVYMESSTCEGHDCVLQGEVTLENRKDRILGNMIICLPNQVCLQLFTPDEILEMTKGQ